MPVVRNHKQTSRILFKEILEFHLCIDVQIVGRLVQNQEVRICNQDTQQEKQPFLPSGKQFVVCKLFSWRYSEVSKVLGCTHTASICKLNAVGRAFDYVDYLCVGFFFRSILCVIADLYRLSKNDFATISFCLLGYYFEQSSLSTSVSTYNTYFITSFICMREILYYSFISVSF